jgi:hypothetical protein
MIPPVIFPAGFTKHASVTAHTELLVCWGDDAAVNASPAVITPMFLAGLIFKLKKLFVGHVVCFHEFTVS